jgi:ubiquitin carboxyl-terminal hydrolase 8
MSSKKELKYTNFEEFMKSTEFDFSKFNFENPSICNTLLKLFDQGNSFLSKGDEETAFQLLFRFFEGNMELRRTKLYTKDKTFIENFISNEKLAKTVEALENLKKNLKARYDQKIILNHKTNMDKTSTENNNKEFSENNNASFSLVKKFFTPKELIDLIKNTDHKILIIDTREAKDFDQSQMNLSIMLADERKKQNSISYINIPSTLIENVVWNLTKSLKKFEKKNALNKNQTVEQVFSSRAEYEYIVMFDQETDFDNFKIDSKLSILKKAIYEYEINTKLKNEPIILNGGWKQWVIYYPVFTTNTEAITSGNKANKNGLKDEKSFKKAFDFDYPELIETNSDSKQSNRKNQKEIELIHNIISNNTINDSQDDATAEDNIKKNDLGMVQNQTKNSIKLSVPDIDRKSKPGSSYVLQIKEIEPDENEKLINNNMSNDINNMNLKKENELENDKNESFNRESEYQNNNYFNKKSFPENISNLKPLEKNNNANLNETIFNVVYAPNRLNKPFHTPYMKDGSAKILNKETGLFSYYPSSSQFSSPSILKASQKNENLNEKNLTPSISTKPQTVPPILGPKPKVNSQSKTDKETNLKRTISSPNIANIDDDNLVNPKDSEDLKMNKNSLNFDKNLSNITKSPNFSASAIQDLKSKNDSNIIRPNINRNSKPMPENVMRSRIEELEPIFGNVYPGLTGIRNLGNTCFLNSIIQCLSMTERLVKYFLNGSYKNDLNRTNELGFRGEIADEFLIIIQSIWGGHCRTISPKRFKAIIGQFNEQFITNEQQDAQELLLFLLDGLHEDLNRVFNRPKLSAKENDKELPDKESSITAWNIHLSINNSIIVDLFQVKNARIF